MKSESVADFASEQAADIVGIHTHTVPAPYAHGIEPERSWVWLLRGDQGENARRSG